MDPITIASIAAPIVGGLLGSALGSGKREEAERQRKAMLDELYRIDPAAAKEVEAYIQEKTGLSEYEADPELRDAQRSAMSMLGRTARDQGMTLEDSARLNDATGEASRMAKANRDAILTDAQARGALGSGDLLASLLQGESAAADRAMRSSLTVGADASRRALEAGARMGDLAGNIRGQDFQEQKAKADAEDEMNRFNASQRTNAARYNNELKQQNFQNKLALARERNAVRSGEAGAQERGADRSEATWSGVGAGVGAGLSAYQQDKEYREWLKNRGGGKP